MGEIRNIEHNAKLFFGLLAPSRELLENVTQQLVLNFSPVEFRSEINRFDHTNYYESEMGGNLLRQWISTELPMLIRDLPGIKKFTNRLEEVFAQQGKRTVNIDPGYISLSKVVLATTKDHEHRLYVSGGIYEEVTLRFHRSKGFEPWPWTYPDYSTPEALTFFNQVRNQYHAIVKSNTATAPKA